MIQDKRPSKLSYLYDPIHGFGGKTWRKGTALKN